MADQDPTLVETQDCNTADSESADLGQVSDITTCATNNDLLGGCKSVGKGSDDVGRAEWSGLADIAANDTITIHFGMTHNYDVMKLLPYDAATTVVNTNKLTYTMSGGTPAVFTLTSGFITDLFDQGSGTWAVRFTEDTTAIDGDFTLTEVQADLTQAGAAARRVFVT